MTFTLEITLGNEEMTRFMHIEQAIQQSLWTFGRDNNGTSAEANEGERGLIRDINGNTVGSWKVQA